MGYWIYRLNLQNGKYEKIATVRGRSSAKYTDRNVRNDSRYYYRVKGFTAKSSTPYSSIMFLPKSVYKKIDSFAVDRNTSTSASLKWAASKDIEVKGYDIYRSLSPCEGFKKTGTTYGINSNAYVDTNLDPHSKYYYKILGWTGTCHTPFSAVMETGMKEGFLTKQDLDALDLDGINKVMIVAHPDDETIFGGKHLLSDKYLVVCVTNRDTLRYGKRRAEEFKRAMDYCGAKCIILGYPDLKTGIIKNDWTNDITGINADVNLIINYKKWDTIVTHNKDGEYGHIHHKKISRVVYDNARNSGKSDLVQVFGPYYSKSNIPAINGTTTDFYPADKELLEKQNMMSSFYVSQKGAIANLCQMFDYEKFVSADSQY